MKDITVQGKVLEAPRIVDGACRLTLSNERSSAPRSLETKVTLLIAGMLGQKVVGWVKVGQTVRVDGVLQDDGAIAVTKIAIDPKPAQRMPIMRAETTSQENNTQECNMKKNTFAEYLKENPVPLIESSQWFVCTNPGRIEISSGSPARSAEVKVGDVFRVIREDAHWYFGKLNLSGGSSFVHQPGLSGKNFSPKMVEHSGVIFAINKESLNKEDDDFWATWKSTTKRFQDSENPWNP